MPNSTVLILGANGRFGRQALHAFSRAGWNVLAQMRRAPAQPLPDGVQALICDALDTRALLDACAQPIEVVVNALNPPYDQWQRMLPPLGDAALELARRTGAVLMLPGNVYNFGREIGPVVGEDAPQRPGTSKAALRIALEQNMAQATAHGVRSVVIRAGDFIGGSGPGTWIDIAIARKLDRHRFVYPGPLDIQHAWAYLPDLARVFVAVAEHRRVLAPFTVLHYAGLTLTGRELHAAYERATGVELRTVPFPWWALRLAAPFSGMLRAVLEMRYLWERPHRLAQDKLVALLGTVPASGLDEVVAGTLPATAAHEEPLSVE